MKTFTQLSTPTNFSHNNQTLSTPMEEIKSIFKAQSRCMVPNCNTIPIDCHSVSKTFQKQISKNKIYRLNMYDCSKNGDGFSDIHINQSSTFPGFCKEHDKLFHVFEDCKLEENLFENQRIQTLLGFRAICYRRYTAQFNLFKQKYEKVKFCEKMDLLNQDITNYFEIYWEALSNDNYNKIYFKHFKVNENYILTSYLNLISEFFTINNIIFNKNNIIAYYSSLKNFTPKFNYSLNHLINPNSVINIEWLNKNLNNKNLIMRNFVKNNDVILASIIDGQLKQIVNDKYLI